MNSSKYTYACVMVVAILLSVMPSSAFAGGCPNCARAANQAAQTVMQWCNRNFVKRATCEAAIQQAVSEAIAIAEQQARDFYNNAQIPRGRPYYNPNGNANSTPYYVGRNLGGTGPGDCNVFLGQC